MSPMVTDFRGGASVRGQMSGQGLATPHSGVQTRPASSAQLGGRAGERGGRVIQFGLPAAATARLSSTSAIAYYSVVVVVDRCDVIARLVTSPNEIRRRRTCSRDEYLIRRQL